MRTLLYVFGIFLSVTLPGVTQSSSFHFMVTGDTHMYRYGEEKDSIHLGFRDQMLKHLRYENPYGPGDFLVIAGDMDPFRRVYRSVRQVMGPAYGFYPVIGNHDVGGTNKHGDEYPHDNWQNAFAIVRYNKDSLKDIVRRGPDVPSPGLAGSYEKGGVKYITCYDSAGIHGAKYTTYSFDHGNSHFIVLDEYATNSWEDRENARIWPALYEWLKKDLTATDKENIFMFGHEPVWNPPRVDSVPVSRQDFWDLLRRHRVVAYFCGHYHGYAVVNHEGVWEFRSSCAYDYPWKAHYTLVFVEGRRVTTKTWELQPDGYHLIDRQVLKDPVMPRTSLHSGNEFR